MLLASSLVYTFSHVVDFVYYSAFTRPGTTVRIPSDSFESLGRERATVRAALAAVLREDGVPEADRWAQAIVRYSPSSEVTYIALVTAQIRRESNFHARDLEWLYDGMIPDVAHELGVDDHVRTIGPMQINRHELQTMMSDERASSVIAHEVKSTSRTIEAGVYFAVHYLDELIREYAPDRNLRSWSHYRGRAEMLAPSVPNHPMLWDEQTFAERCRVAALQKMLSDLTGHPLVLDGLFGERTAAATRRCGLRLGREERGAFIQLVDDMVEDTRGVAVGAEEDVAGVVRRLWEDIYGAGAPPALFPRVAFDERLVFVLADFNSGRLASRIAAVQQMLVDLGHGEIAIDGKLGPLTRAALIDYLEASDLPDSRREDYVRLLETGQKRLWTIRSLTTLVGHDWERRFGGIHPTALCPDLAFDGWTHRVKGIGKMTTRDYVIASTRFFEEYDVRLRRMLPRVEGG